MKTKIWIVGEDVDDVFVVEYDGFVQPQNVDYIWVKEIPYQIVRTELDIDTNTFNIYIDKD